MPPHNIILLVQRLLIAYHKHRTARKPDDDRTISGSMIPYSRRCTDQTFVLCVDYFTARFDGENVELELAANSLLPD